MFYVTFKVNLIGRTSKEMQIHSDILYLIVNIIVCIIHVYIKLYFHLKWLAEKHLIKLNTTRGIMKPALTRDGT